MKVTAMTKTATTLVTGRWRGRISSEHPDRQGRLLAGGEGGDDDLVEGEREGQHAAGQQGRGDVAAGSRGGRSGSRRRPGPSRPRSATARCGASGRRRCCRRRRCRRWRGRARWSRSRRGCPAMPKAERSAMPVTMPGSAIGRMISSEMASRPKKRERADGGGGQRAEDQGQQRRDRGHLHRQPQRLPDVVRAPRRRANHCSVRPGGGKLIALLVGGEGVEQDERQRQMQEEQPAERGELQAPAAPLTARQSASKAPSAWRSRGRRP